MAFELYFGIKNYKQDIVIGFVIFLVFALLATAAPAVFSLGLPDIALSATQTNTEKITSIGFFAPLWEETAFRGILLPSLIFPLSFVPVINVVAIPIGIVGESVLFGIFHKTAYGGSLTAQNATIIGAIIFGMVVSIATVLRKSIIVALVAHSAFNIFLFTKTFVILG